MLSTDLSAPGPLDDAHVLVYIQSLTSEPTVQVRLQRFLAPHLTAIEKMVHNVRGKFSADLKVTVQDLKSHRLTLADVTERADVSARELVQEGLIEYVDDCEALGVTNFENLITQVGPPHSLSKWMKPEDWSCFVSDLINQGWWTPSVWLKCCHVLDTRDLAVLGVELDDWFEQDPVLFERARKNAADWFIDRETPKKWEKRAGLSLAMQDKLVLKDKKK